VGGRMYLWTCTLGFTEHWIGPFVLICFKFRWNVTFRVKKFGLWLRLGFLFYQNVSYCCSLKKIKEMWRKKGEKMNVLNHEDYWRVRTFILSSFSFYFSLTLTMWHSRKEKRRFLWGCFFWEKTCFFFLVFFSF